MAHHEAGDVVWGPDAFHDDDPALALGKSRPWLIVNNAAYPGDGEHYLVGTVEYDIRQRARKLVRPYIE